MTSIKLGRPFSFSQQLVNNMCSFSYSQHLIISALVVTVIGPFGVVLLFSCLVSDSVESQITFVY